MFNLLRWTFQSRLYGCVRLWRGMFEFAYCTAERFVQKKIYYNPANSVLFICLVFHCTHLSLDFNLIKKKKKMATHRHSIRLHNYWTSRSCPRAVNATRKKKGWDPLLFFTFSTHAGIEPRLFTWQTNREGTIIFRLVHRTRNLVDWQPLRRQRGVSNFPCIIHILVFLYVTLSLVSIISFDLYKKYNIHCAIPNHDGKNL